MTTFAVNQTSPIKGLSLVYADEFNGTTLPDQTHSDWNTTLPGNMRWLSANNESQIYLDRDYRTAAGASVPINPFSTGDGTLTITANPTPAEYRSALYQPYTSGIITSYDQRQFTYGYFEIRADLPGGKGLWPALWLRSADSSVRSEIDILEFLGSSVHMPYQTVHTDDGSIIKASRTKVAADLSQGMHTFGVDWHADYITFYVDGVQMSKIATPASVKGPMYFIANLATGGWAGPPDGTTPFPAQLKIDYVHVFQSAADLKPLTVTGAASSEKLFGADGADTVSGGGGNDTVLAGGGGDTIHTGDGNDRIVAGMGNDTLCGDAGADTLLGGLGNDTFLIKDSTDKVCEMPGAGIDTVRTTLGSYALPGYVENLTHEGSNAFTGNGNSLANVITDGTGRDTLFGAAGNDTVISQTGPDKIDGGDGNDRLLIGTGSDTVRGGAGEDMFVFTAASAGAADVIQDFTPGTDHLDLRVLGLASFEAVLAHASNTGVGVVIEAGGETVTLNNIKLAQLHAGDFVF